jgi:hypothetical protein
MIPMVDGDGIIARQLSEAFPGWNVWRSYDDAGKPRDWYANRDHVLTGAEMYAGLAHTLAADTALELRAVLERQVELDRQIDEAKRRARPRTEKPAFGSAYM